MPATNRKRTWLRFDVRLLLFWLTPYVALVAATFAWRGPYKSEFLNQHVRMSAFILESALWANLFLERAITMVKAPASPLHA